MVSACPHAAFDLVERMFERGGNFGIVRELGLLPKYMDKAVHPGEQPDIMEDDSGTNREI